MNDFFRFFISGRISGHVIGYPENSYFCKANQPILCKSNYGKLGQKPIYRPALNRRLLSPEQKTLDAAYEDYIDLLHGLTVQSCKSSLDLLHELARLQSCLMRLQERIVEKESPQVLLLKSALLLTNFEIRLVFTRVRYPSIAAPVSVEVPKSPLFLSEQFTPSDIMELATALQLSGAIRRIDGTRIDLATLVDVLSGTFNVRINNPEQCRHTLINRKLRLTHFLDILRNNLIAYSQR